MLCKTHLICSLTLLASTCLNAQVVIHEIHYNPCSEQGSDNDFEFVELYNADTDSVELNGWLLTGAFELELPDLSLAPGEFIITANQPDSYADAPCAVLGWDSGSINNQGETIVLLNALGETADEVSYSSSGNWPDANGNCFSLELRAPDLDNTLPESWCAVSTNGTPGLPSGCDLIVTGCTDATACNFIPEATSDDGSCTFPFAGQDCAGNCLEDVNQNGLCDGLETFDLSQVCGAGTTWDPVLQRCVTAAFCIYDPSGDGFTGCNDLLMLLAHYGQDCVE